MIHAFMLLLLFNVYKLSSSPLMVTAYLGLILAFYLPKVPKCLPLLGLALLCILNQRGNYELGMTKHSQILLVQLLIFMAVAYASKLSVLRASHMAIAAYYLTTGLTKIKNSLHYWVLDAKNIAFSIVRAADESFYTNPVVTSLGKMDEIAVWIYEHEFLAQMAFLGVLLLELGAIFILNRERLRKIWGLLIVGLHLMTILLLNVKFLNNLFIVLIFCVFNHELEGLFSRWRSLFKKALPVPLLLLSYGCSFNDHLKYNELHYKETRSRPLESLEKRMVPYSLVEEIRAALKREEKRPLRILEIGQGNGRVLLTLMKQFQGEEIEYFGINKEVSETFRKRDDYIMTALKFNLFDYETIRGMKLPKVFFIDADNGNKLPFQDNYFDIIFSQSTMQHIERKFELLNENVRVLKENGVALHTSFRNVLIYKDGKEVPLEHFFHGVSKEGNVQLVRARKEDSIFLKKSHPEKLHFEFNLKLCREAQGMPVFKGDVIEYREKKSCYSI